MQTSIKYKIQNKKQIKYDLEERTYTFAKEVRTFVKQINKKLENVDDLKQVIRSSGSIAANYIEANESLSKKDFLHRIRIARKEAKETKLWLRLLNDYSDSSVRLLDEANQLLKILSKIYENSKDKASNIK